jgi:hypothetical protein
MPKSLPACILSLALPLSFAWPHQGTLHPEDFGASHSITTASCDSGDNLLELICRGGTADFAPGQGIDIAEAGPPTPVPLPSGLALTLHGTPGSTIYAYALCAADLWKGISGCTEAAIQGGPPSLNAASNIEVTYDRNLPNAAIWLLYRRVDNGFWHFVTTLSGYKFRDQGWVQPTSAGWPPAPPQSPMAQDHFSIISAVSDDRILLVNPLHHAIKNKLVQHDDVLALQAAYDACDQDTVALAPFTYRLVRPSLWNYERRSYVRSFTADTPGYPLLYPEGVVHPPSGCATLGAGRDKTILLTDFMNTPTGGFAVIGMQTGLHASPNSVDAYKDFAWRIASAAQGGSSVQTLSAADAAHFHSGDHVLIRGGRAIAGPGTASAEINQVVSADPTSGIIRLQSPLLKPVPLGAIGTAPEIIDMEGNVVKDLSFRHLTIATYSTAFTNTSPAVNVTMEDIHLPFQSNGDYWYGGYRSYWTNIDVDIDGFAGEEIDLDDHFVWEGGSCYSLTGHCFGFTEASTDVSIKNTKLAGRDSLTFGGSLVGVQGDISRFSLTGSALNRECSAVGAADDGAIIFAGGIHPEYVPSDIEISGNTIYTNCKIVLASLFAFDRANISNNNIKHDVSTLSQSYSFIIRTGVLSHNKIEAIAPPQSRYTPILVHSGGTPFHKDLEISLAIADNVVRVDGAIAQAGVVIGETKEKHAGLIGITENIFCNVQAEIAGLSDDNAKLITATGNTMLSCGQKTAP